VNDNYTGILYQGIMVGFKDELLFSHNKKELTKDLPYFEKVKVRCTYYNY